MNLISACEKLIVLWLWWFGVRAGGADASHNACLHIDSLFFDDAAIFLTVSEMLLQGWVFILPFYCTTLILSCCEIFLMPSVLFVLSLSIV